MTDYLPDLMGPWLSSIALAILAALALIGSDHPSIPPSVRRAAVALAILLAAPLVVRLYLYAIGVLP